MKKGIIAILSSLTGGIVGAIAAAKKASNKTKMFQGYADKHLALFFMMNNWVRVKQENKSIVDYLEKEGLRQIAIYGMSHVGDTLLHELQGSNITVKYGIDKNADNIYTDINVLTLEDDLETVDAVIVTAITFFSEIDERLSKKMRCPILSLEDILNELLDS
ncbi:MAG: hypothetical protein K2I96_21460 [Lachnospiraceae bacterium]|nr:hypothetical protein [Lachnospiraceae bacterium]